MPRLLNDDAIGDLEIEQVFLTSSIHDHKKHIRAARLRLAEIEGLLADDDRRKENMQAGRNKAKVKPR